MVTHKSQGIRPETLSKKKFFLYRHYYKGTGKRLPELTFNRFYSTPNSIILDTIIYIYYMSLSGKYITNLKGNYGSTASFASAGRSWLDFVKSHKGEGKSLRELGLMYRNQNSSYKKQSHTMPGGTTMPGKRHRKRKY